MACLRGGGWSQDWGKVQAKNRVDCNIPWIGTLAVDGGSRVFAVGAGVGSGTQGGGADGMGGDGAG